MVKENNGNYECEECGFIYKDKAWAQKCEMWCKINKSCNLKITKHAQTKFESPRDDPVGPDINKK